MDRVGLRFILHADLVIIRYQAESDEDLCWEDAEQDSEEDTEEVVDEWRFFMQS